MSIHVRVCRDCGEEYRPEIVRCADCGGVLDDRFEEDDEGRPPFGWREAPEARPEDEAVDLSGHRPVFLSNRAADLVPLAEALRAAGIAFHLVEQPAEMEVRQASFSLLVREEDFARTQAALAPLIAPGAEGAGAHSVDAHFEEGRATSAAPRAGPG